MQDEWEERVWAASVDEPAPPYMDGDSGALREEGVDAQQQTCK